jgi:hypothetical protein
MSHEPKIMSHIILIESPDISGAGDNQAPAPEKLKERRK